MWIFDKYPDLAKQLEELCRIRRDEILSSMVETDSEYENLRHSKSDASMALRKVLTFSDANILFERYSNAIYAQEVYELDAIYRQAQHDTLDILKHQKLL